MLVNAAAKGWVKVAVALALSTGTLAVVTGCSGMASLPASDSVREPVQVDGGTQITVPALWADAQTGDGGIEPARIRANPQGSAQFTIELSDLKAQGAGAQWTAASSAAAAVGSMASGLNPGRIDIDFDVSGPIDGPSAGGLLTVGVIAALLGVPIRGDITMTGTISPDGSIGAVSEIPTKLQAAADQGYRTVLLPIANMNVRNPQTGGNETAKEMGARLGLDVRTVGNVQEAFTIFTDGKYSYPSAPAFTLSAAVTAVAAQQVDDLLRNVAAALAELPANPETEQIAGVLATAQAARDDGQVATAYGVGMQGLNMARREQAAQQAKDQVASSGVTGGTKWLRAWVDAASQRNSAALAAGTQLSSGMGYEQQVTLPNAMSWLVYNEAILQSVRQQVDGGALDGARIDRLARVLADVDTAIEVSYPDQLAIVQAAPTKPSPGDRVLAEYLADYTTFLVRAGQAQQNYVQQVLMSGQDPVEIAKTNDVGLLLPAVLNLADAVNRIPNGADSIPDAVRHASTAITYYIATTSLIASVQDFGIGQFGIGADPTQVKQEDVLTSSVMTAKGVVDQVAALLGQRGLDASLPVWASAYGTGAAQALSQTPMAAAGKVLALNELYFDAITVFMLQSGPVP